MKLLLLIIFTFAFSSCKQAWTQKDKETFMGGCVNGALKEWAKQKQNHIAVACCKNCRKDILMPQI